MGGAMRQLLSFLGAINGHPREKKKTLRRPLVLRTVELRVRMDCEREVKNALSGMRGVQHVEVNRPQQRVTVTGEVDLVAVLRRAQSTGKNAEPWTGAQNTAGYYAPAGVALYGIGPAHDGTWADPAGCYCPYPYPVPVRSVEAAIGAEQISSLFSDDNPNACSVM